MPDPWVATLRRQPWRFSTGPRTAEGKARTVGAGLEEGLSHEAIGTEGIDIKG